MYTAVLMLALTSGAESADHGRCNCSCYCYGCYGCYSSYCYGCYGGSGAYYRIGYGGGYYGGPSYASSPYYMITPYAYGYSTAPYASGYAAAPGMAMQNSGTQIRQANYYDPNQKQQPAMVRILLPNADAEIWFDGTATKQRGTDRMFISSPVDAGSKYNYTIKAHWTEDGRPVNRERRVEVQPGRPTTVDFRTPSAPAGEKLSSPKGSSEQSSK